MQELVAKLKAQSVESMKQAEQPSSDFVKGMYSGAALAYEAAAAWLAKALEEEGKKPE